MDTTHFPTHGQTKPDKTQSTAGSTSEPVSKTKPALKTGPVSKTKPALKTRPASKTKPASKTRLASPSKTKPSSKTKPTLAPTPERVAIMQWTARIGAVTAEALADRLDVSVAAARGRLQALQKAGWLSHERLLAEQPALFTATRAGLRVAALQGLDPCRVSASNAHHLIVCAWVAAALERCYPDHAVLGERELRRDERERGVALASARLGIAPDGGPLLHRPDLVLWPQDAQDAGVVGVVGNTMEGEGGAGLPVAVEVELTVKAPQRLAEICRAWARCRCVAGVIYLAPPEVRRALERAIDQVEAGQRIAVLGLDAVPRPDRASAPDTDVPA
jgi:hypothetical protein